MLGRVVIRGHVASGFGRVADTFAENFRRRGELGASFCAILDGEPVVDIWSGVADPATRAPWQTDTISTLFSATKGLAATGLLVAADRGKLDYDAPVTRYWPEFGRAGKGEITVRALLNHRAGVVGFDKPVALADFEERPERVREAMEAQSPVWSPDTDQGYHGVTFGPYAGELFRRAMGESLGVFLAREVFLPLGAEVHLGLPAALEPRVARMVPAPALERLTQGLPKLLFSRGLDGRVYRQAFHKHSDVRRAFAHPGDLGLRGLQNFNSPRVHGLELPWANGLGNARGLARLYAALASGGEFDGVRVVRPETLTPLRERQSWVERDRVLRKPLGFAQGFIKEETQLFSPNPAAFGHPGAGGTLGFADPDARLGIGYVMNQMTHHIRSPRAIALCHSLYRCL